jgi:hypothetical protein
MYIRICALLCAHKSEVGKTPFFSLLKGWDLGSNPLFCSTDIAISLDFIRDLAIFRFQSFAYPCTCNFNEGPLKFPSASV